MCETHRLFIGITVTASGGFNMAVNPPQEKGLGPFKCNLKKILLIPTKVCLKYLTVYEVYGPLGHRN